jgi:hypothetical protein
MLLWVFLVLFILVWEHIGRKNDINLRPSIVLNTLTVAIRRFARWLGGVWAWVSSFLYEWATELVKTISTLAEAILHLIGSPLYFTQGYIEYALRYTNFWWIRVGSAVLIFAAFVALRYSTGFDVYQYWCDHVTCDARVNSLILWLLFITPVLIYANYTKLKKCFCRRTELKTLLADPQHKAEEQEQEEEAEEEKENGHEEDGDEKEKHDRQRRRVHRS